MNKVDCCVTPTSFLQPPTIYAKWKKTNDMNKTSEQASKAGERAGLGVTDWLTGAVNCRNSKKKKKSNSEVLTHSFTRSLTHSYIHFSTFGGNGGQTKIYSTKVRRVLCTSERERKRETESEWEWEGTRFLLFCLLLFGTQPGPLFWRFRSVLVLLVGHVGWIEWMSGLNRVELSTQRQHYDHREELRFIGKRWSMIARGDSKLFLLFLYRGDRMWKGDGDERTSN